MGNLPPEFWFLTTSYLSPSGPFWEQQPEWSFYSKFLKESSAQHFPWFPNSERNPSWDGPTKPRPTVTSWPVSIEPPLVRPCWGPCFWEAKQGLCLCGEKKPLSTSYHIVHSTSLSSFESHLIRGLSWHHIQTGHILLTSPCPFTVFS